MVTKLLNVGEGAKELRLAESNVRKLIRLGKLPVVRLGRRVLIAEADIQAFIEASKNSNQIE